MAKQTHSIKVDYLTYIDLNALQNIYKKRTRSDTIRMLIREFRKK